jgi:hypothetical protein
MRRIGWYVLNVVTVVSLVLSVATAALWVRSRNHLDTLTLRLSSEWSLSASTASKQALRLTLLQDQREPIARVNRSSVWTVLRSDQERMWLVILINNPINFDSGQYEGRWVVTGRSQKYYSPGPVDALNWEYRYWALHVPYWCLSASFAALPASRMVSNAFRRRTRRRRRKAGRCPSCNYDLRATPDRCPECGTIPAKA